jgi:hypothetical protein
MLDFSSSLALLVLGQIPLLVKLWLDQKNSISGHRLEMYKRQLQAAESLCPPLLRLQASCDLGLVLIRGPKDTPYEERAQFVHGYTNTLEKFQEAWEKAEVVLPSSLVLNIHNYYVNAVRIHFRALGVSLTEQQGGNQSYEEIQSETHALFNSIRNSLRLFLGTDPLTSGVMKQIYAGSAIHTLLIKSETRLR